MAYEVRQCLVAWIPFHNAGRGWASLIQDPRAWTGGGKYRGRTQHWPPPLTIIAFWAVCLIFCFPETFVEN
jgi:hypothetical protein